MRHFKTAALGLILSGMLAACGEGDPGPQPLSDSAKAYQADLLGQLLDAQPGDVITIPEGIHEFDRSLSLSVDGVTLRGAGMDRTVLSFKNQIAGAEGLLVTASDFTMEDLAVEDTVGDAVKITDGDGITIRRVRVEWTNGPATENGAYGLYPVQTKNVLIEDSVAIAASDAGIYVGQSQDVIIRRNKALFNVAGIEVENTVRADVYNNIATDNTGGILVFNMPALKQTGYGTRIFGNQVFANNTDNFGHPGTPVASVPAGSGVVINSNDGVEIFDNTITDNRTANLIISSVYSTGYSGQNAADGFDPYPESIFIYSNAFSGGGDAPDGLELKALKTAIDGLFGSLPHVLWDGYQDADKLVDGKMPDALRICIQNDGVSVLNADGPNDFGDPKIVGGFDCTLDKLPPVKLGGR